MLKNKVVLFLVVFLVFSPCLLFSSWNLGNYVDDFGDDTGEHFITTAIEGKFSNSATSSSNSPMRILIKISGDVPQARITFEPHAYSWDNPVEDFYDDSTATIKFKDDAGNVITITRSNSKYGHNWNLITQQDAVKIINLFRKNKTVKVSIKIESYSFNYTVDCSDFLSVYDAYFPSDTKVETGKWDVSFSESSYSDYDFCSASINFESSLRKAYIIGTYSVNGYPDDSSDYPSISFDLSVKDSDSGLFYTPNTYPDSNKEVKFNKISFTVGKENYTYTDSYASKYPYFSLSNTSYGGIYMEISKLHDVLKSGQTVVIDLYTTEGDVISYTTSASEFLKYVTYPYQR
jgi:hypothetical protein